MKVVHIGHVPVPTNHPDADTLPKHSFYPGRWVLNLALAQKQHTSIHPEIVKQVPGASKNWTHTVEGIPVHFVAAPIRLRSATLFYFDTVRMRRVINKLAPDIVHAHGTEEAAALTAALCRKPSILTFQGVAALMNKVLPPPLISRRRMQELAERLAVSKLRHAIVKSDYGATSIAALFPHLTLHHIPNTYLTPQCPANYKKNRFEIAFAGTIVPRKGFHFLTEAVALLLPEFPNLRLHVFGNRSESSNTYEKENLARLKIILRENLILHGVAPKKELDETLARVQALVAPSLEEMFGNQVIEALLVGTHVIASKNTPMEENIQRFGNGSTFPMGDSAALSACIRRVLSMDYETEARQSILNIEQFMSPETVSRQHLAAYETVIADWPGRANL